MSNPQHNQSSPQPQTDPPALFPDNLILNTMRQASSSIIANAEQFIAENEQPQTQKKTQSQEQYNEEQYQELSSGVYKVETQNDENEGKQEEENVAQEEEHKQEKLQEERQKQERVKQEADVVKQEQQVQRYQQISQQPQQRVQQQAPTIMQQQHSASPQQPPLNYPSIHLSQPTNQETTEPQIQKNHSQIERGQFQAERVHSQVESNNQTQIIHSDEEDIYESTIQHQESYPISQEVSPGSKSQKQNIPFSTKRVQSSLQFGPPQQQQEELIELDRKPSKVTSVHSSGTLNAYIRAPKLEEIPIEESHIRPSLKVQIQKGSKNVEPHLRIIGYEKEYFLKIQTQVYQVEYVSAEKTYIFCRKFADFVVLHKLLKLQYPGCILHPFPQNSLQFFKTLKLSVGSQLQKVVIIQKRLLQLQKYLNFLLKHPQLSHSQIFQIFITQSSQLFTKQFLLLQQAIDRAQQQYKVGRLRQNYNSIKNLVKSGINFFSGYMSSTNTENATLLLQIHRRVEQLTKGAVEIERQWLRDKQLCDNLGIKLDKLVQIYSYSQQLKPLQSNIDSVLKFSSKTASSKTFFQTYQTFLQDNLLLPNQHYLALFFQIGQMLQYRKSLLQKADKIEEDEIKMGLALVERVEEFDKRFTEDWPQVHEEWEVAYEKMVGMFGQEWRRHCGRMIKVWK